jgi:hypothetical protein
MRGVARPPEPTLTTANLNGIQMNEKSDLLSWIAIVISLASPLLAGYVIFRDRARLKITSAFYAASEYGPARIQVVMINVGRRPVIVRMIGGSAGTDWNGEYIESAHGGKRLGENERYEYTFTRDEAVAFTPDEDFVYEKLWVEDSLGIRYPVPNSEVFLKRLWE